MNPDVEVLEEQVEKLKNAVKALASFTRSPQERLDSALSYFVRTFRSAPEGEAFELYRAIYAAIGDPPVGTTIQVMLTALDPSELEAVPKAMVELCDLVSRRYADALHSAPEGTTIEASSITGEALESLVPARGWSR
jgi:hypothetical protein